MSNFLNSVFRWSTWQRGLGGFFLFGALLLGAWANERSEKLAIYKWEKSYLPSLQVMEFAVQSRGMKIIRETDILRKVHRLLGIASDEQGSFWLSADSSWLGYFSHSDGNLQVYCFNCQDIPPQWHPIGIGWRGFEEAFSSIDSQRAKFKIDTSPKKSSVAAPYRDPRAISY